MPKNLFYLKFFGFSVFWLSCCMFFSPAFAATQENGQPCPPECVTDSMEIVTWYPSPYNEYEELRLYPISDSNSQCNSDTRGLMYYDSDEDKVKLCKGPAGLNNFQELGGAGVPAGFVGFFNLSVCPTGWSELTAAKGRYLVGLPSGGTLAGTKGTALSNLEDRPVGQHNHTVNDPGHGHSYHKSVVGGGSFISGALDTSAANVDTTTNPTGISINNSGIVSGTNAHYLQLLVCQKD